MRSSVGATIVVARPASQTDRRTGGRRAPERRPPLRTSNIRDRRTTGSSRDISQRSRLRRHLRAAIAGALALVLVVVAGIVLTLRTEGLTTGGVLSVILQSDQQSGSISAGTRSAVEDAALAMSTAGGGRLVIRVGAGGKPASVATADLAVTRDGNPESDPTLRAGQIRSRVGAAFATASKVPVRGDGRSLAELFAGAADDVAGASGAREIWVRSFGLATDNPTDTRVLMNADPAAAVASLPASAFVTLKGAHVHWIFPAATGDQSALNLRTEKWRTAFLRDYIKRSGGVLASTQDEQGTGPAATDTPNAPVVPNLPEPTPATPKVSHGTLTTTIDTASLFLPDQVTLIDPAGALDQLRPLAAAWATGAYASIVCTGRIAAFGAPGSAVGQLLSEQRANAIVALLSQLGTPSTAVGVGASRPLPGDPRSAIQRSVTCVATPVAAETE